MDRPLATTAREPVPIRVPDPESQPGSRRSRLLFQNFRSRLISGLIFCLPIAITFSIVYWLLLTIQRFVLDPLAGLINQLQLWIRNHPGLQSFDLPGWWFRIASPILALLLGVIVLYFLGLALRSWVYRTIDWILLHVPVVATIYRAVRNVVESLGSQFQGGAGFKRVVLVEFPHPGMRSLGLVTNSLKDATTGRTILTVCVMTGIMPPTGFTLFVPEESVTNIAWNVNDTLQAILSGGITTPPTIHYFEGLTTPFPLGGGPIVDTRGNILGAAPADGTEKAG
jgi:uncharacterized membrane protein